MTDASARPFEDAGRREAGTRLLWVDHARGLAIILVVFGHSFRGVREAGLLPPQSVLSTLDYLIYSFHMPVFFFLSGLFARNALARGARRFWWGRLTAIAWPYVLWMTVELGLLATFASATNMGRVTISPAIFLWDPISPFWFLWALLACNAVLFALQLIGSPAFLAVAAATWAVTQWVVVPPTIVREAAWGLLYFGFGLAGAATVRTMTSWRGFGRVTTVGVLGASAVAVGLVLHSAGVPSEQAVPTALLGLAGVFATGGWLARCASGPCRLLAPAVGFIAFLGRISLTVMVVHILGTAATRILLLRLFGLHVVWLHLLLGTAAGLMVSALVQAVAARLGVVGWLGLPNVTVAVVRRHEPRLAAQSRDPAPKRRIMG